jgi:hypothetical protein
MLTSRLRGYLGLNLCRIVSRPLSQDEIAVDKLNSHIFYRPIGEQELLQHCADPELVLSPRYIRLACARGDLCVAAFDGTRLVGYQWFAFGATPHVDGVWVDFSPGACYCYNQFVRPAHRGQHIAAGLTTYGGRACMLWGCRHTVAFIDLDNRNSWKATSRVSNSTIGYVSYIKCFGFFLSFRTRGAIRFGFRFYVPPRARNDWLKYEPEELAKP